MNDVAATFAFTVILFLFAKAVFERSDRYLILAGFALGVGFLIKYTIAVIALAFLVFLAAYPKYRKFIFGKSLGYAIAIAAVMTLPFWAWNATHDWAGFVYQGGHASPFLGLFVGGGGNVRHELVERAGDFVTDDESRLCRQGPGDADALLLPSGQLRGIAVVVVRWFQLDQVE